MELDAKKVERISKALGDPYRLKIMEMAKCQAQNDWLKCSCIGENIELAQSTISHHISQLVDADLLITEKDGRNVRYRINKDVMDAYIKFLGVLTS
jgi:ArsR family transcriptional regulator, arsenate/arsenite/antimonite-responsive transcriptional repressor